MGLVTVYKKCYESKYRTQTCSSAMLFHVLSVAAILLIPLVVGFYSRNLWVSELTFVEQPDVQFKYKLLVYLRDREGSVKAWSTWSDFNTLSSDILTVPVVSVSERDADRDGRVDSFNITLQFKDIGIVSCQALLVFQYKLSNLCSLVMETPLFIQKTVDEGGLVVFGDLELTQREKLQPNNPHTAYDTPLISRTNSLKSYDIVEVLNGVSERTLATRLSEQYSVTIPGSQFSSSFLINVPDQHIRYEPGFWEGLKYAWIQYLALLVVAYHVITRVRGFVFLNMILTTLKQDKLKEN